MGDVLDELLARIESVEGAARRTGQEVADARNNLREVIRKGETTGDKVRDFLLVAYGPGFGKDTEDKYRALADRFVDKKDKPVLIRYQREEPAFHSMIHQPNMPTQTVWTFKLGILSEEPRLDVQEGMILFPTKPSEKPTHAEYGRSYSYKHSWKIKEGNLAVSPNDFATGARFSSGLSSLLTHFDHSMMDRFSGFFVGDEIEGGLKNFRGINDNPFEASFLGSGFNEFEYAEGLKLLGAPLPDKINESYNRAIESDKKEVLRNIYSILTSRLMAGENRADDTLRHIHVPEILERAINLGMHKDTTRFSLDKGVDFEIGKYVRDLCEEYKVKI